MHPRRISTRTRWLVRCSPDTLEKCGKSCLPGVLDDNGERPAGRRLLLEGMQRRDRFRWRLPRDDHHQLEGIGLGRSDELGAAGAPPGAAPIRRRGLGPAATSGRRAGRTRCAKRTRSTQAIYRKGQSDGARWRRRAWVCHDAPVPISDRLLMGPGPSNPYPEVAQALAGPVLGHLDPDFLAILDATNERLRQVFATANPLTLPVSGTGSAGMEASFVNFVRPGDPVVIGVNGVFGERMCEVAERLGAQVVRVDAPWGTPIEPDALLAAHPAPSIIAVVHAETSTGVRNDIAPLGAQQGGRALAGRHGDVAGRDRGGRRRLGRRHRLQRDPEMPRRPAGPLAPDRLPAAPGSAWWSARRAGTSTSTCCPATCRPAASGGRVYHHTAPVTMMAALHAGLGAILDEGLDAARARHAECGQLLQDGLEALGLKLFAQADHRLPQLTTVEIPAGSARRHDRGGLSAGSSCTVTGSRSVPEPGSWRARCGGSAAWATRRAVATSWLCSVH